MFPQPTTFSALSFSSGKQAAFLLCSRILPKSMFPSESQRLKKSHLPVGEHHSSPSLSRGQNSQKVMKPHPSIIHRAGYTEVTEHLLCTTCEALQQQPYTAQTPPCWRDVQSSSSKHSLAKTMQYSIMNWTKTMTYSKHVSMSSAFRTNRHEASGKEKFHPGKRGYLWRLFQKIASKTQRKRFKEKEKTSLGFWLLRYLCDLSS